MNTLNLFKIKLIRALFGTLFLSQLALAAPSTEGIQVYQKNLPLMPEHKQKLAEDIHRYRTADNLWELLREEFTLPHYEDNQAVQEKIEWYMNNQDFLLRSATRAAPYLYYIFQQVRKRHLPAELVLLPIIESGYNPFSLSSVGAAGIWQLMPATAAGLGVRQDSWYDGRRDVVTSTRAALNHLVYLERFFDGNWLLALAAYDTGEGNVQSAIRRNISNGLDTDFWSLPLAAETRNYVPSLLALATIISHPDQYPIYFPAVRNAPYLAQIEVERQINLKYAATLAGLSHKKLMTLNSGYSSTSTAMKGAYKLVLPIENVEQFTENLARSPLNRQINWTHYKLNTGDTLVSVAKKFNTSEGTLQTLNHLSNKKSLRRGSSILIPVAKNGGKYLLQPGDTIYMVRTKDTLESIAKRFHITSDALRTANKLTQPKLMAGKQIIIPTHPKQDDGPVKAGDTIYMVRRGDNIQKIATKFHTSPAAIRLANLVDDHSLHEGDRIVVPTHMQG